MLDGIDLVVGPGTVHGLVGPNGAGKTTLLRLVLGLLRPTAGTVRALGVDPCLGAPAGLAGFADAPKFYPYLTGRQNLALLGSLDGGTPDVTGVLERVGLAPRADERTRGWSTGMRQRLGLAAALLRRPRLLVLDEPASGLDPSGAAGLHDLVREIAADGTTVLLSSHDMDEVDELCSRVTVIDRGRVVLDDELGAIRDAAPSARFSVRTSDDAAAAAAAGTVPGVRATRHGDHLVVEAERTDLDAWVVGLGRDGIAIRELVTERSPLVGLFLSLTSGDAP